MTNKRGQGLSTNAIVLINLALIVLVRLVVGFTVGWSKFAPFLSGNNVDTIVTQCSIACSTESTYDYCSAKRTLKADDKELGDVTCFYLSEKTSQYGLEACSINCDAVILEVCDPLNTEHSGKISQIFADSTNTLVHTDCL